MSRIQGPCHMGLSHGNQIETSRPNEWSSAWSKILGIFFFFLLKLYNKNLFPSHMLAYLNILRKSNLNNIQKSSWYLFKVFPLAYSWIYFLFFLSQSLIHYFSGKKKEMKVCLQSVSLWVRRKWFKIMTARSYPYIVSLWQSNDDWWCLNFR